MFLVSLIPAFLISSGKTHTVGLKIRRSDQRKGSPSPWGLAITHIVDVMIESQRDSVTQPRVARNELPWVRAVKDINPERVAANPNGPAERVEGI